MLKIVPKQIITSYGITYRNEPWHRRCFTCTNCKTNLSAKQFTSRDEKPYCPECFGKLLAESNTSTKNITGKCIRFSNSRCFLHFWYCQCSAVGVCMKKELPEKRIKNFLREIFNREMRLNKESWKRSAGENLKASHTKTEIWIHPLIVWS